MADGRAGAVRLIAYVVLARSVDARDLRRYVEERLPDAMVPAAIIEIPRLPLLPSGKLDRSALPPPHLGGRDRSEYADETERRLAAIWQDVLNVDHVGPTDNFTDLGGDSLQAVVIAGRAGAAGIPISAADVLRHENVTQLRVVAEARPTLASVARGNSFARASSVSDAAVVLRTGASGPQLGECVRCVRTRLDLGRRPPRGRTSNRLFAARRSPGEIHTLQ